MTHLEDFLTLTQEELFAKLCEKFKNAAIYSEGDYILIPGDAPIMLVAHLDTVHKTPVKEIFRINKGAILTSPQGIGGDDRCGVYSLVKLYRLADKKPWLLFTCDEEIGAGGAIEFCTHYRKRKLSEEIMREIRELKLLVELDRTGENDAVYYSCENCEFESYITSKGFTTEWGSFSDISYIAPELGIAAVNLSSGYYNAHSLHEYINTTHLESVIQKVKAMIDESTHENFPKFEYIEYQYTDDYYFDNCEVYEDEVWEKAEFDRHYPELRCISEKYIDYCIDLLDYYTPLELKRFYDRYGENIIKVLHETEIGSTVEAAIERRYGSIG